MIVETAQAPSKRQVVRQQPRLISKEEFLQEYANREDGFKYEWNNGIVEKTESMNQQQFFLQDILLRLFIKTKTFQEGGTFTSEGNMDTAPKQFRKPDLAIYTAAQMPLMRKGEKQIPPWVAEVISPSDKAEDVTAKTEEYFRVGVRVVWNIYPYAKQVYVFTSPDDVTVCRGKTICSGAPALPDFQITAEDLFA